AAPSVSHASAFPGSACVAFHARSAARLDDLMSLFSSDRCAAAVIVSALAGASVPAEPAVAASGGGSGALRAVLGPPGGGFVAAVARGAAAIAALSLMAAAADPAAAGGDGVTATLVVEDAVSVDGGDIVGSSSGLADTLGATARAEGAGGRPSPSAVS